VNVPAKSDSLPTLVLTPEGKFEKLQLEPVNTNIENGQYHLLLPSGKVERVQYSNQLNADNRLTSTVQHDQVNPISGPVYSFGSPLVRVVWAEIDSFLLY